MFKKILFAIFLLISVTALNAGLFGDNSNSNTLETSLESSDDIVINNIELANNIKIISSKSRFIYDLLDASVMIKNNSYSRYVIEYKFLWYDINGFEFAKKQSKWKKIRIDSKDTIIIKGLAISPKVETFKLYIRRVD